MQWCQQRYQLRGGRLGRFGVTACADARGFHFTAAPTPVYHAPRIITFHCYQIPSFLNYTWTHNTYLLSMSLNLAFFEIYKFIPLFRFVKINYCLTELLSLLLIVRLSHMHKVADRWQWTRQIRKAKVTPATLDTAHVMDCPVVLSSRRGWIRCYRFRNIIIFFVWCRASSPHATSYLTGGGLIAAISKSLWEIANNEHEICSLPMSHSLNFFATLTFVLNVCQNFCTVFSSLNKRSNLPRGGTNIMIKLLSSRDCDLRVAFQLFVSVMFILACTKN